jgi:HEAT repeat protein
MIKTIAVAAILTLPRVALARSEVVANVEDEQERAMEIASSATNNDARYQAIRTLGELRPAGAIPLLLKLLSDSNPNIRANAARALSDMNAVEARQPLVRLLLNENDGAVIEQITFGLLKFKLKDALPRLRQLARHKQRQTRIAVLQTIGAIGSNDDVAFLAVFLDAKENQSIQWAAAESIERITGENFGLPLRIAHADPAAGIKRAQLWWQSNRHTFEK